jgi:PncC family amidohydrolase
MSPERHAAEVVARLAREEMTLALAESCTGGAVMAALTDVPGASEVLWGGAVVYSESAKEAFAGVGSDLLVEHGPVSAAVTEALALGLRERAGTDLAAAVTGWAGPEHGAEPAGTVYIAIATAHGCVCSRAVYDGDRRAVRAQAVAAVLGRIAAAIDGIGDGELSA